MSETNLQILISAYGPDALEKIGALPHASLEGVEYLVGWQNYDIDRIPETVAGRPDYRIIFLDSVGLCNNRNALLEEAEAPVAAIADDDLVYSADHLQNILKGAEENPDCHFLTFRYASPGFPKSYPQQSFDLSKPPKGYFVTSMELVFNLRKIRENYGSGAVRFDPAFGVNGTLFVCGEEDVLVHSLRSRGMKGRFVPKDICVNTDSTTAERIGTTRPFVESKGAVMRIIHPYSRHLRMLAHAWRHRRAVPFLQYCRWWLAGERKLGMHNRQSRQPRSQET